MGLVKLPGMPLMTNSCSKLHAATSKSATTLLSSLRSLHGSDTVLGPLNHILLIVDTVDAGRIVDSLRPLVEAGRLLLQRCQDALRDELVVCKREESQRERTREDLGQSNLVAAPKVRLRVLQQRLNLLGDNVNKPSRNLIHLGFRLCELQFEQRRVGLAKVRVDEKVDACAAEGGVLASRGGDEVGRVGVGEELADDGGLCNDFAVIGEGRDEAARVDGQVLLCAGHREVDDFFLKGEAQFCEGDVCTVSP